MDVEGRREAERGGLTAFQGFLPSVSMTAGQIAIVQLTQGWTGLSASDTAGRHRSPGGAAGVLRRQARREHRPSSCS